MTDSIEPPHVSKLHFSFSFASSQAVVVQAFSGAGGRLCAVALYFYDGALQIAELGYFNQISKLVACGLVDFFVSLYDVSRRLGYQHHPLPLPIPTNPWPCSMALPAC